MQTKKYLASAFGYTGIVDVVDITEDGEVYTLLDGDFLRNTWFTSYKLSQPHHHAKKIKGKWTLQIAHTYIIKELSSLEQELY